MVVLRVELGQVLRLHRHWMRGITEGKRAVELDPLSIVINVDLAETFFYARRYDDAGQPPYVAWPRIEGRGQGARF